MGTTDNQEDFHVRSHHHRPFTTATFPVEGGGCLIHGGNVPALDPGAPIGRHFCLARMVKLVDAADLKSAGAIREGSIPSPGTTV